MVGELSLPNTITLSEDSSDGRMTSKPAKVAKRPSKFKPFKMKKPGGAKTLAIVRPTRRAVRPATQAAAGTPAAACTGASEQQPLSLAPVEQPPQQQLLDASEHPQQRLSASEQQQQQQLDPELLHEQQLKSEQPQQQPSELEQLPANPESRRKRQLTELELEDATTAAVTYAVDVRRLQQPEPSVIKSPEKKLKSSSENETSSDKL
jgi:hypothetical protein